MNKRLAAKIFNEKEILSTDIFYEYITRSKIIVFVPHEYVEKIAIELSKAGAGQIGNYDMCSFRTEGTGTYRPNEKADPYTGKKKILSKVEEVKLEMECDPEKVNDVLNVLIKHHPYEEIAYEIHEFKKRGEETGLIVSLKSRMNLSELLKRMNKKIDNDDQGTKNSFRKVIITNSDKEEIIIESMKFTNCEYLISILNKKYKLYKL